MIILMIAYDGTFELCIVMSNKVPMCLLYSLIRETYDLVNKIRAYLKY